MNFTEGYDCITMTSMVNEDVITNTPTKKESESTKIATLVTGSSSWYYLVFINKTAFKSIIEHVMSKKIIEMLVCTRIKNSSTMIFILMMGLK